MMCPPPKDVLAAHALGRSPFPRCNYKPVAPASSAAKVLDGICIISAVSAAWQLWKRENCLCRGVQGSRDVACSVG